MAVTRRMCPEDHFGKKWLPPGSNFLLSRINLRKRESPKTRGPRFQSLRVALAVLCLSASLLGAGVAHAGTITEGHPLWDRAELPYFNGPTPEEVDKTIALARPNVKRVRPHKKSLERKIWDELGIDMLEGESTRVPGDTRTHMNDKALWDTNFGVEHPVHNFMRTRTPEVKSIWDGPKLFWRRYGFFVYTPVFIGLGWSALLFVRWVILEFNRWIMYRSDERRAAKYGDSEHFGSGGGVSAIAKTEEEIAAEEEAEKAAEEAKKAEAAKDDDDDDEDDDDDYEDYWKKRRAMKKKPKKPSGGGGGEDLI